MRRVLENVFRRDFQIHPNLLNSSTWGEEFSAILSECLGYKPWLRPSFSEICDRIAHVGPQWEETNGCNDGGDSKACSESAVNGRPVAALTRRRAPTDSLEERKFKKDTINIPLEGVFRGDIKPPQQECCGRCRSGCLLCQGGSPDLDEITEGKRIGVINQLDDYITAVEPQVTLVLEFLKEAYGVDTALLTTIHREKQMHPVKVGTDLPFLPRCQSFCGWMLKKNLENISGT